MKWKAIIQNVQSKIHAFGLDLLVPLSVKTYHETIPPSYHLPYSNDTFLILIGHSRTIWKPFIKYLSNANTNPVFTDHPFQDYIQNSIKHVIDNDADLTVHVQHIYYSWDTRPGHVIAIQRMAVAAGLATLCPISGLCIHPTFGPWFALSAVIVCDVSGPTSSTVLPERQVSLAHQHALAEAVKDARADTSETAWKKWIYLRQLLHLKHPFEYSQSQSLFHYASLQRSRILDLAIRNRSMDSLNLETKSSMTTRRDPIVRQIRTTVQEILGQIESKLTSKSCGVLHTGFATSVVCQANGEKMEENFLKAPTILHDKIAHIWITTAVIKPCSNVTAVSSITTTQVAATIRVPTTTTHIPINNTIDAATSQIPTNILSPMSGDIYRQTLARLELNGDPLLLNPDVISLLHLLPELKKHHLKTILVSIGARELFHPSNIPFCPHRMLKLLTLLEKEYNVTIHAPFLSRSFVELMSKNVVQNYSSGDRVPLPIHHVFDLWGLRRAFPESLKQWNFEISRDPS